MLHKNRLNIIYNYDITRKEQLFLYACKSCKSVYQTEISIQKANKKNNIQSLIPKKSNVEK